MLFTRSAQHLFVLPPLCCIESLFWPVTLQREEGLKRIKAKTSPFKAGKTPCLPL